MTNEGNIENINALNKNKKTTTAKKNPSVVVIRLSKPIKMAAIVLGEFFRSLYI
jgi:hypothetical protein